MKLFCFGGIFLLSLILVSTVQAEEPFRCGEYQEVGLEEFWAELEEEDPGYRAARRAVEAAEREEGLHWRESFDLSLEAQGDLGQRASPSEEREMGFSYRGDLGIQGSWVILESSRGAQEERVRALVEERRAGYEVFDEANRRATAAALVEIAAGQGRLQALREQRALLDSLAETVERRRAAGVESDLERRRFEEASFRSNRLIGEEERRIAQYRERLAITAGRCITPVLFAGEDESPSFQMESQEGMKGSREEVYLRRQAERRRAESRVLGREGLWELRALGVAGIYGSLAFESGIRPEYYAGLLGVFRPDFAGVRMARREAAELEAATLEALALRERWLSEQERRDFEREERDYRERLRGLREERALSEAGAEATELRWRQGVEHWREMIDAAERLRTLRFEEVEIRRSFGLRLIDFAVATGQVDSLPRWLGSEFREQQ